MRFMQRRSDHFRALAEDDVLPHWLPPALEANDRWRAGIDVIEDDSSYVTIDERVGGRLGVVATSWPRVDDFGLIFTDDIETAWFDVGDVQRVVDEARNRAEQTQRPVRTGDAFWVHGFNTDNPFTWGDVLDVTHDARALAKAAVAHAAFGEVAVDEVFSAEVTDRREAEDRPDSPPPPPSPAGPATALPTV